MEKSLQEKIAYLNTVTDKSTLQGIFSETEWDILCAIWEFKEFKEQFTEEQQTDAVESKLYKLDCEKPYLLRLKKSVETHIDVLLQKQSVSAWFDLWFLQKTIIPHALANRFWEFYILEMTVDVFMTECEACSKLGTPISVLQFQNMQEITETYFKTIFLLRRIEYDMEPMDEILDYIGEKNLSTIYLNKIIEIAQIFDKEKVRKKLGEWGEIIETK